MLVTDRRTPSRPGVRNSIDAAEIVQGLLIGAAFLLPLLAYGPWEDEEVQYSIFPNQLHYRALFQGRWLYWFNNLGFGTPLPLGHRHDFNPLFAPLVAFGSVRLTLSVVWVVHTILMVVYFLRVAALAGIRPPLRVVLLACYLFSAISISYFYATDWLTAQIVWSFCPVLLFYLWHTVSADATTRFWLATLRLALLLGFLISNGNPGYVAPTLVVLGIYAIAAAPLRPRVYACLVIGGVIALSTGAERLYFTATEALRFPASVGLDRPSQTLSQWVAAAFTPFTGVADDLRIPFVGLPLAVTAIVGVARFAKLRNRCARVCAVVFVCALLLSLAPRSVVQWFAPSGAHLFRDFVVLFALLTAGHVLQSWLDGPQRWQHHLVWLVVLAQVVQQGATVWPAVRSFYEHRGVLEFYRHQEHPVGLAAEVVDAGNTWGSRVFLSGQVETLMRGYLSPYGLHLPSDLALHGLSPINGWFKGVSMDTVYPSALLMHGAIHADADAIDNKPLLDVLGVNLVWTTVEEHAAAGLVTLARDDVQTRRGDDALVLLRNPGAWPQAVMMKPEALGLALARRPRCPQEGALCRDFQPLVDARLSDRVSMTTDGHGHYRFGVTPGSQERVLFASVTYRPEWRATSPAGALRVEPVANAFVGVRVPPGVESIDLEFVPRTHILLTWFSALTFLFTALSFAWTAWQLELISFRPADIHAGATAALRRSIASITIWRDHSTIVVPLLRHPRNWLYLGYTAAVIVRLLVLPQDSDPVALLVSLLLPIVALVVVAATRSGRWHRWIGGGAIAAVMLRVVSGGSQSGEALHDPLFWAVVSILAFAISAFIRRWPVVRLAASGVGGACAMTATVLLVFPIADGGSFGFAPGTIARSTGELFRHLGVFASLFLLALWVHAIADGRVRRSTATAARGALLAGLLLLLAGHVPVFVASGSVLVLGVLLGLAREE